VPESGSLGSVRGATSNGRSYRETTDDASKGMQVTSKLGARTSPRKSVAGAYLLAMWCPVYRWRDSDPGLGMELGNSSCNAKGKPYKCETRRGKVPMCMKGADHPVVVTKRL
jgi:hypothetical protein